MDTLIAADPGIRNAEVTDWRVAHAALVQLARRKAGYDAEEARWLVAGKKTAVHKGCGYGSYLEYLERVFGYGPRMARERLRVAEALQRLPVTMAALESGKLRWSGVRELSRVATAETEPAWVEAAANRTIREIEDMVSGRVAGDRPTDPARPEKRTHVLRLELTGATYARYRQVLEAVTRDAGHSLTDDEAMTLICDRALASGGQADEGRASYTIVRGRCVDCDRLWQEGGSRPTEIDETAMEIADCDGLDVGDTHVGEPERAVQSIPPKRRRASMRRAKGRCEVPGCRHSAHVDIHHIKFRCDGGTHAMTNLVALCSVHHGYVHQGRLLVSGRKPRLEFFHADGRPYGEPPPAGPQLVPVSDLEPPPTSIFDDAVSALANLGYRKREAREAVQRASRGSAGADSVDDLVRAALRHTPRPSWCREPGPVWIVNAARAGWSPASSTAAGRTDSSRHGASLRRGRRSRRDRSPWAAPRSRRSPGA